MSEPYANWNPTRRNNASIRRALTILTPKCEAPGCHVTAKTTVRLENGELSDVCLRHFIEFGEAFRDEEVDQPEGVR